jgi:hypothetical protein
MKNRANLKIPLLKLKSGKFAISCLERTGVCVARVKEFDPLNLSAGKTILLQDELSEKKYLTVIVAIQMAENGDRYFVVQSCPGAVPPDSAVQDCAERSHNHAVANGLKGSPFYS